MPGPWAEALLAALGARHRDVSGEVTDVRIEPSLITARVEDRAVTLSAPPIPAGIWAALGSVPTAQSEQFAQQLEHTWEEPLVPRQITRVGAAEDVAAVALAVAGEIERDPSLLLRWRGYGATDPDGADAWHGGELPPLPPPARRPPESVPKRFGASGIQTPDGDLVEVFVRAYRAFADEPRADS
jgi:hypothetical protein